VGAINFNRTQFEKIFGSPLLISPGTTYLTICDTDHFDVMKEMNIMESIFLLALLGFGAWFWFDTQHSQEMAKSIAKEVCVQLHLQLLDDTIALVRVRLKRKKNGKLSLQRTYQFEFYDRGDKRLQGTIIMLGISLEMLELPGYMNRTISPV